MKKAISKGPADVTMLFSIAVLAVSVIITLICTLLAGRSGATPETATGSAGEAVTQNDASAAKDASTAYVTPDWMSNELILDEMAEELWTPAEPAAEPAEGGEAAGEPDTQEPETVETPPEFTNPFSDVKEGDYFYAPLMWAAQNGIVSGNTFSPGDACSRAQAMTFLWRQQGSPEPALGFSPFADVTASDYFYKPVLWAFEHGLISTPADGRFNPGSVVNRAQVMTFLYRTTGEDASGLENPYTDVTEADYFYAPALWAYSRGIVILDVATGTFNAGDACTRGQYLTFLYRCFAGGQ